MLAGDSAGRETVESRTKVRLPRVVKKIRKFAKYNKIIATRRLENAQSELFFCHERLLAMLQLCLAKGCLLISWEPVVEEYKWSCLLHCIAGVCRHPETFPYQLDVLT